MSLFLVAFTTILAVDVAASANPTCKEDAVFDSSAMSHGLSLVQVNAKYAVEVQARTDHAMMSQHPNATIAGGSVQHKDEKHRAMKRSTRHHIDPQHKKTSSVVVNDDTQHYDNLWNASLPERIIGHRIVTVADVPESDENELVGVTAEEYWKTVPWAMPVFLLGLCISMRSDSTGISQALGAACIWGVNGFLIALSGCMPPDSPYAIGGKMYMGWMWSGTFIVASGCHFFYRSKHGAAYAAEIAVIKDTPGRVWVAYALAAITCCAAEACLQSGFSSDEASSGPHFAIATANAPIVSLFFWFYSAETMAFWQLVGLCAVVIGTVVMSGSSMRSALAVTTMIVSMLFWSVDLITIRLAGVWGGKPCVGVVVRLFMISCCGLTMVVIRYLVIGASLPPLYALLPPMLNSLINGCGFLSLIHSFEGADSVVGVNVGLLPSQTLVMTLMNFLIIGWCPHVQDWLGMMVVSVGCVLLSVGGLMGHTVEESFEDTSAKVKHESNGKCLTES